MDWEDCVVDVHSVKLAKSVLESMFETCGPVRSILHWKGQNEKPHIFFEYKTPAAADAARIVGLDRSDVQVIKIANNELLKRKFRELAHGPIRERDPRRVPSRFVQVSKVAKVEDVSRSHGSLQKPTPEPSWSKASEASRHDEDRRKSRALTRMPSSTRDRSVRSRSTSSVERDRRSRRHRHDERSPSRVSKSRTRRDPDPSRSRSPARPLKERIEQPPIDPREDTSLAILHIPHAGEIIRIDLNTQLDPDPSGIIRMLTAVRADQKLWMITAAYYKGKQKLEAAKKVLEAGIDMAVRTGVETDTRPFWHLLSQINETLRSRSFSTSSIASSVPRTSETLRELVLSPKVDRIPWLPVGSQNNPMVVSSSSSKGEEPAAPSLFVCGSSKSVPSRPKDMAPIISEGPMPPTLSKVRENTQSEVATSVVLPRNPPTGPRILREPFPPSSPTSAASSQVFSLQNEIRSLRDKQDAFLEDLSMARAAKRRAEDEVREERVVRRKLEKDLRALEDTLARSKRMEMAAFEQVKREVEARRKAENLLNQLQAESQATASTSLTSRPVEASPATALLQLINLLQSIPSAPSPAAPSSVPSHASLQQNAVAPTETQHQETPK
ncbi:hypothetical protein M422DRAFT_27709 [Sphaerobolus stellatus SS14]|nr:hypothetical protein M422DRAFT_27709 [Sphaerobolus stellatus SS14]